VATAVAFPLAPQQVDEKGRRLNSSCVPTDFRGLAATAAAVICPQKANTKASLNLSENIEIKKLIIKRLHYINLMTFEK
jgi:hypothetical protein